MKKVKIMLTAIAVFAIVGGTLAFKARTFSNICYWSSDVPHSGEGDFCLFNTVLGQFKTTTDPLAISTYATTVVKPSGINCTQILTPTCPALVRTTNE